MFELFEIVVYRGYGVAKISREVTKKIENRDVCFFELNFIAKEVKILVPKNACASVNLRKLHSKEFIEEMFLRFLNLSTEYTGEWIFNVSLISWNRRSKDYQIKIITGDMDVIAKIYLDLNFIERNKKLSFGEKTLFNQIEDLIVEEIAVVFSQQKEDVLISLRSFVSSFFEMVANSKSVSPNEIADSFFPYFSSDYKKTLFGY